MMATTKKSNIFSLRGLSRFLQFYWSEENLERMKAKKKVLNVIDKCNLLNTYCQDFSKITWVNLNDHKKNQNFSPRMLLATINIYIEKKNLDCSKLTLALLFEFVKRFKEINKLSVAEIENLLGIDYQAVLKHQNIRAEQILRLANFYYENKDSLETTMITNLSELQTSNNIYIDYERNKLGQDNIYKPEIAEAIIYNLKHIGLNAIDLSIISDKQKQIKKGDIIIYIK